MAPLNAPEKRLLALTDVAIPSAARAVPRSDLIGGLQAGDTAQGTQWDLRVLGGDPRITQTRVNLQLGGCGELEPPMLPEEVTRRRQNFDWTTTSELPTTDSEGMPAIRYALIYLESDEQLDALRRMGVYFRAMPLFGEDLQRYEGECGVTQPAADLRGQFVYAIIPAALYNLFRNQAVNVIEAGEGLVPFRAIILPEIPDEGIANPDGTVSWQVMKESGFRFFDPDVVQQQFGFIDDAIEVAEDVGNAIAGAGEELINLGGDVVETGLSILPTWDDIVEAGVDIVEGVWDEGLSLIGGIEELIAGSVRVRIDVHVLNRDPRFGTNSPMTRQWGPNRGAELVPHGIEAEIVRWSGSILGTDARMPTRHTAKLGRDGRASIRVAEGGQTRGGGLCFSLENDAGMISSAITEREFCDFSALGPVFDGFRHDVPVRESPSDPTHLSIALNHAHLSYLSQITDGHDYAKQVMGRTPVQAEVAVGYAAETLGAVNGDRAFVACLDFNALTALMQPLISALSAAGPAIGLVDGKVVDPFGLIASPLLAKDMFLMKNSSANRSRGTVTHEYGHFLMCDIFADQAQLYDMYFARISDGFSETREDGSGIYMESWADFFESQVASGVNYVTPEPDHHELGTSGSNSYCTDWACLEMNHHGLDHEPGRSGYHKEIGRMVSVFHDAVDRRTPDWRATSIPTNGDAWRATNASPSIVQSPDPYAQDRDDDVKLSGAALVNWMANASHSISPEGMLRALSNTMLNEGFSWCSICELFAQHDPAFSIDAVEGEAPATGACSDGIDNNSDGVMDGDDPACQLGSCKDGVDNDGDGASDSADTDCTDLRAIWESCRQPAAEAIVGFPPAGDLRLEAGTCEACEGRTVSNAHGECVECPDAHRVVGNQCEACPSGHVGAPDGTCEECARDEIVSGNKCVPCPGFQIADRETNTCVDCSADAVVDAESLNEDSIQSFSDIAHISPAGDTCPDEFWLELRNVEALYTTFTSDFNLRVVAYEALDDPECQEASISVDTHEKEIGSGSPVIRNQELTINGRICGDFCQEKCIFDDFADEMTSDYASNNGITTVRYRLVVGDDAPPVAVEATAPDLGPVLD